MTADRSAIILAGGRARRLGGVDKPALSIGGRPLIARVVAALAQSGVRDIVVVGPDREGHGVPAHVRSVIESPSGSGPAAATVRGLESVRCGADGVVAVVAGDLPSVGAALGPLLAAAQEAVARGLDGAMATSDGQDQYLLFAASRRSLEGATAADTMRDGAMRTIISRLRLERVDVGAGAARDVDTWDAVVEARAAAALEESHMSDAVIDDWIGRAAALAQVDPARVDVDAILDLARDAAHGVARPAAPITAFLLGYAAAAQGLDDAATAELAARLGQAAAGGA